MEDRINNLNFSPSSGCGATTPDAGVDMPVLTSSSTINLRSHPADHVEEELLSNSGRTHRGTYDYRGTMDGTTRGRESGREQNQERQEGHENDDTIKTYNQTDNNNDFFKAIMNDSEGREKRVDRNAHDRDLQAFPNNSTDDKIQETKNRNPGSTWNRIKGGQEAEIGEWPWMVYLRVKLQNTVLNCGGSILTASFVLTAGHCVYDV